MSNDEGDVTMMAKKFLRRNPEKGDLNQYWYSSETIKTMADEVVEFGHRCAFLSTPSIYFAVKNTKGQHRLFDYDTKFEKDNGYVHYDFNSPDKINPELHHTFDMVVIDPPFITREVWEKYTTSAKLLLKKGGRVLLSTIPENKELIQELLSAAPQKFRPSIPSLVYQYNLYTNYESSRLNQPNSEIENV